ncbi:site-specific integrase [Noviherbaspirillum aridicola]|uniref:Integrase n=1 Tax=Noviherbaspirillum aridicola TaxID=2849687 RepID=A0ABQ4Q2V1_9BURK|nr:site-specific integrase [Noviherbaspirillum aridicola]GIZ51079.1 integrase [Noviherbaspirillum aridicola]
MSVYVRTRGKNQYQLRVRHPLIPPNGEFYATFDDKQTAREYGDSLQATLDLGIVPTDLQLIAPAPKKGWSLARCIDEYLKTVDVKHSDYKLLATLRRQLGKATTADVSYSWAETWHQTMKREQNLTPGTIRKRHGALARCLDWVTNSHPEILATNPLRLFKRGYATYSKTDASVAIANGGTVKKDQERNRRLPEDEAKLLEAKLEADPELELLHHLGFEAALRMRECYTLSVNQIWLDRRTICLTENPNRDTRQVPMSEPIHRRLSEYLAANCEAIAARGGRLFSWWQGQTDDEELDKITAHVSGLYADAVAAVGLIDFHFHDLRHEATCRLYLLTNFTDVQIARITGHRDFRMLKRYASLRGSELADRMWGWSRQDPDIATAEWHGTDIRT